MNKREFTNEEEALTVVREDSEASSNMQGALSDETTKENVITLSRRGWSKEEIAKALKISPGEVELTLEINKEKERSSSEPKSAAVEENVVALSKQERENVVREQVIALFRQGWENHEIVKALGLSPGEVELILEIHKQGNLP